MSISSWLASLSHSRRRKHRQPAHNLNRSSVARREFFERLEDRQLLAGDWHNAFVATDVNNDRHITPTDVLNIINKLNTQGAGPLSSLAPGVRPKAYYDTNGDGYLTPQDALVVINAVNLDVAGNRITDITALSRHYIQATFEAPISDALMFPEAYVLTGPDSNPLEILSVTNGTAPNQVILTTVTQTPVNYTVALNAGVTRANSNVSSLQGQGFGAIFGPADTAQPQLVDIIPVNETTLLATYDRPMGASAIDPANYRIVGKDGQLIPILGAQFGEGESVVQLQTAPQSSSEYSVTVQNIIDRSGQTVFFEGRKVLTGNPKGAVVSVAATSSTRVVVVFNEAMADNALAPQHYSIKDPTGKSLLVTDAQFDGPLGMVVVLTTAAQANVPYQLNVSVVTDLQNDGLEIKTGSFQGIVGPALFRAIPTLSTRLVLTFTGPVGDSALAPSTYKIEQLNALGNPTGVTIPITDARFIGDQRTVLQLTTASQSDSRYRISTTTPLTDVEGSSLPAASADFQGIGSRPTLVSTTSAGPTTLLVTFSEAMSDDALAPASYTIKSATGATLRILSVRFVGTERRVVELTTEPQNGGTYTVQSITATDLDGNKAVVPNDSAINQFQGVAAPTLVSVSPTDTKHLFLTFGGPVGDSALSPSSYKLERLDAQGNVANTLAISAAEFVGNQRTVVSLTTPYQSNSRYRITTRNNLTDASGSPLTVVSLEFQGLGSQPKVVSTTSTGPSTVLVTFSVPMSEDALTPAAYVIRDSAGVPLPVTNVQFVGNDQRVVQLTTGAQAGGTYSLVSITATDLGGTAVTVPNSMGVFVGAPAPVLTEASPADPTHIVLTFTGPVSDSALAPSSYLLEKLNAQGIIVGSLPISAAAFIGSQNTVVSLTTPYLADGRYRISTTAALTDTTGSPLTIASLEFQGIGTQPKLLGATSTGANTIHLITSAPMSDDVLAPSSYVIRNSAAATLEVLSAQFVGTERRVIQLTTAPQAAGAYTILSLTANDLSGNPLAAPGATGVFQGAPEPKLIKSIPTDPNHIVLTFGAPVGDSALAPSSYNIDRLDSQGNVIGNLTVESAEFLGDQKTVVSLATPYQSDSRYRISTTSSLSDATGAPLAVVQQEFHGVGSPVKLVAVTSTGPSTIQVIFNVPMSDDALSSASYEIESSAGAPLDVLTVEFIGTERRVLELTTAPQTAGSYTIQLITATDINGSPVTATGATGDFQGTLASSLSHASPADPTHIVLTFGSSVGDSALAQSSYKIDKLDAQGNVIGSLTVSSLEFVGDQRRVVSLTTPYQPLGRYRISTTTALRDVTGAPLPIVQLEFQSLGRQAKLVDATSTGPTTMLLTFNVPMSDDVLSPGSYSITNSSGVSLPVVMAQFAGTERRVIQLTTSPQSAGTYTIQSITATDMNGDSVASTSVSGVFQGVSAPSLSNAIATDATHIYLTFAGPVGDSALSPSSYQIQRLDAQGNVVGNLAVSSSAFVGNQRTVVALTTPSQTAGQYRLSTTSSLTDISGSIVPAVQQVFSGASSSTKLVGATSIGATTMLLTFNVSMSDDVLSPASYVINNSVGVSLPVVAAEFVGTERRVVQLTTGPQSAGTYTIQSITATDTNGNSVSSIGSINVFQGVDAPSLNNATATDATHVYLTFAGPVGDSALSPSSYQIQKLDAQGNVIGNLAVSSAAFVGNQRTVVAITTPSQTDGQYRLSTTSTLTDVSGSPVPVMQLEFQGLGSQARLVTVSSTSINTMIVTFSMPMSDDALSPSLYLIEDSDGEQLPVFNVQFIGTEHRVVQLTTAPQTSQSYTVISINATDVGGSTTIIPTSTEINTFPGPSTSNGSSVPVDAPPRVVGAASLSNTSVLVAFSEPMADNALNTAHYFIVQQNVNSEVGFVPIVSAAFNSEDRRSVLLTTASQNELTYAVTALNVTDLAGHTMAPAVLAGGQRIDPSTAQFPGTPPSGAQIVDSDGDGLSDNVEVRGWVVTVTMLNGSKVARQVTGDPNNPDADGDGLWDAQELNIGIDPRAADTDGDQINDWAEFNEIYSDPTNQDSDGDTLDDFLEFAFFKTSPVFADSDGDQLRDDAEILGNRNPRVSDLPRPEIDVGRINLQLDVRFSESNAKESRDLETRSVTSTLTQSESRSLSRQYTANVEAKLEHSREEGSEIDGGKVIQVGKDTTTSGLTVGFTFQQTEESSSETTRSYENSLSTEAEVTSGFTVERQVVGAVMQATVELRNLSNLGYRVKNLQVTAFVQDPQDRTQLTPVATLLPDSEPDEGFALGPFVTNRGPLIFSNSTIVPTLVESLMRNSSGLIFRISNYDIVNEDGRNFAFISQDVVERTAQMVIDFGGARSLRAKVSGESIDENQPGDETEIHRVATSAGEVIDTNFDETIDENDRRATFDGNGKEVGITLFEALSAIGLTRYEARGPIDPLTGAYPEYEMDGTDPVSLSDDEILNSYSTFTDDQGRDKIYRIRGVANNDVIQKFWEILTPLGIDQVTNLNDLVLKTNSPVSLNYVQDLDQDALPADVEYFLRTSDSPLPFGAVVPGATDTTTDSVRFNTDPGLATGTLARVTDTATGGGLTAGQNYFLRRLADGFYSFYNTAANANAGTATGRIDLTDEVSAGVFSPTKPVTTNTTAESVSFDPGFATGTAVQVSLTGGGLIAGVNYYIRNLGGASYGFYDTAAHANDTASEDGRINLTGYVVGGIFASPSGTAYNPVSTDFANQSVSFDFAFATDTVVNVTAASGGLLSNTDYFLRNLGGGSYSFYDSVADAITDQNRVDLTANITAGVFSPTAKGRDTDRDGLDDRFESLIGWTVSTPLRTYTTFSSPNRRDSNFDHPKLGVDSDKDGELDRNEYDGSDLNAGPAGWNDKNHNKLRDRFEAFQIDAKDLVLDPIRKDTDGDGINDATEVIGFQITRIEDGSLQLIDHTDPLTAFSDSDTFTDGFEKLVGLDPTDGRDTDEDGDGLPDLVEFTGWKVFAYGVSTIPFAQGTYAIGYGGTDSPLTNFTTDLAANVVKFTLSNAPNIQEATLVRVTGGGLQSNKSYFLGRLSEQSDPNSEQYRLYESAVDAIFGTSRGALDLTTSAITNLVALARKSSSTESVDSDEDGLTDYEEFFLKTDPSSRDSDNDGIEDRIEQLGYALGHKVGSLDIGIIQTNPLDADTDNDLRSDGDEAELVDIELERWVVRTTGSVKSGEVASSSAYRAFSNPLVADADYDGLVDGEEFFGLEGARASYRTDPNNANTDGDKRDDGVEITTGTNPLVDDFLVTVFFNSLSIGSDGVGDGDWDFGDEQGDFAFDFGVRLPGAGSAGLDQHFTSVVHDTIRLTDPYEYVLALSDQQVEPYLPNPSGQTPAHSQGSMQNNQFSRGIAFEGGDTLKLARFLPVEKRSFTFGMTANQAFSVEGIVAELDLGGENGYCDCRPHNSGNPADYSVYWVYLGGVDGLLANSLANAEGETEKARPVFRGSELQVSETSFLDYEIQFAREDNLGGNNGDSFYGKLSFTIFIG